MRDEQLKVSKAMPSTSTGTTTTNAIQLKGGSDPQGKVRGDVELCICIPSLTATQFPANGTFAVEVQTATSDTNDGWSIATSTPVATLTSGTSGGITATSIRYRFPSDAGIYARVKGTFTGGADASSATMTVWLEY